MIAVNEKFALLALDAEARLGGALLEIAPRLYAFHEPPIAVPDHWRNWLGTVHVERIERCGLFVLATMASEQPNVLDEESEWLQHRAHLFYRAMALASVGFHARHATIMVGAQLPGEISLRRSHQLQEILHTPGTPAAFIVTPAQFRQANRVARVLWALGLEGTYGRLWRSLRAFEAALHTHDLSTRLHQLVRAIEGLIPIPSAAKARGGLTQSKWFASKGSLVCSDSASDLLIAMYEARGATEHMALPVRDILKRAPSLSAAAAEVPFAQLVFLGEGLARHILARVIEDEAIRVNFATEDSMLKFWGRDDAVIHDDWGDPFPVEDYMRRFDARAAESEMEHVRAQRQHARMMFGKAPPGFRSDVP